METKKILSGFISAAMLLTSTSITTWAETNSIQRVYADNYGLDIVFANDVAADDYADLSFADQTGAEVAKSIQPEGNIVHLNFNSQIATGEDYYLSVGGSYKKVKVVEVLKEDFESQNVSTKAAAITADKWYGLADPIAFITNDEKLGADSKKLAVAKYPFTVRNEVTVPDDITFSLDMRAFVVNGNGGNPGVFMCVRSQDRYNNANCYGLNFYQNKAFIVARKNYGNAEIKEKWLGADFAAGNLLGAISYDENAMKESLNYEVTSTGVENKFVLRNYGNVLGGYYNNEYLGTIIDDAYKTANFISCYAIDNNTLALIDNVNITTSEVTDVDLKNLEIASVYADESHIVLNFGEEVTGRSIAGTDKISIKDLSTGENIAVNASDCVIDGNTIIVKAPLETNTQYKLSVGKGFGTDMTKVSADTVKFFEIAELWSETFDDMQDGLTGEALRGTGKIREFNKAVIKDGKLWTTGDSGDGRKGAFEPLISKMQTTENATFSFNMDLYANLSHKNFTDDYNYAYAPYNMAFFFNMKDEERGWAKDPGYCFVSDRDTYAWQFRGASALLERNMDVNDDISSKTHNGFVLGDAVAENGTYRVIAKGEALPSGYTGTSEREAQTTKVTIQKLGNTASLFLNDVLADTFATGDETVKTGDFAVYVPANAIASFDNMKVTEYKEIDAAVLNVADVTADANKIYVTFDGSVANTTDFTGVSLTENKNAVEINCTVDGNVLTIVPANGIVSDAIYEVAVAEGFGPSELTMTDSAFAKKFSVTVYANETFDKNTFDNTKIKVETEAGKSGYSFANGGLAFYNTAVLISDADFINAEKYTVKFDYKVYDELNNVVNDAEKNYDTLVPYDQIWFNAPTASSSLPETAYWWYIQNRGIQPRARVNCDDTEFALVNFAEENTAFGDGIFNSDDSSITLINAGDNLVNDYDVVVEDASGEAVLESTHLAESYQYKIDKAGVGAKIMRNGALVSEITGEESAAITNTKGYFGLKSQITDIIWIDNLQAYSFNELSGMATYIDAANSKVTVENFDDAAQSAVVVVCAYSGSRMLDSYIAPSQSFAKGEHDVNFTLNNVQGATEYRAFVLDNLTNLRPLAKKTVYTITQ